MSITNQFFTIFAVIIGTMTTRFLAFLLFPAHKKTPDLIKYLAKVLPGAALGLLVIYSFKDIDFMQATYGLPEIIASFIVILLHLWKKKMILSISVGTISYILLLQFFSSYF